MLNCNCENMTNSLRDRKVEEFFRAVLKNQSQDSRVSFSCLGPLLASMGRNISDERLDKIKVKFREGRKEGEEEEEGVNLDNKEFLMTIASLNVVDVKAIEDSIFSTAFQIFDQDSDGLISLHEARIVLSLFLPVQVQQEQEVVETILYGMDSQKDGYIRYTDLVRGVRDASTFSLNMYREEFILASLVVAGFLLYQLFKQYGIVPVIGVYEGPIGT